MTDILTVNLGQAANDGTGDPLRTGGDKINQNFAALNVGKQEASPKLTALAAAVWQANYMQYQTGAGSVGSVVTSAYGRGLLSLADGEDLRASAGAEPEIAGGTAAQFWNGLKAWTDFAITVRSTVLTGLSTAIATAIVAGDTLIVALGKLQGQLNNKEGSIAAGTTAQYFRGDKSWRDLATDIRAAVLTGLSTATATAVVATDSVLIALGKLQGQVNGKQESSANLTSLAGLTLSADQMLLATGAGTLSAIPTTAYGRGLLALANSAAAQSAIGGSTVGRALFTAASEAAARTTLQLGTGATLDVTTTAFDIAANRLIKVGDFGLGTLSGLVATSAQLDGTSLGGGTYRCDLSSPWRGLPAGVYGISHNPLNSVNASMQVAVNYLTGTLYARGRYQDNFKEHYNTGNAVGTVAQSGGVPTGAIIERGSNANGEYTKYADGTMVCWHRRNETVEINTASSGVNYSPSQTWNFPQQFSSLPTVSILGRRSSGISWVTAYGGTASSVPYNHLSVTAQPSLDCAVHLLAIGRWF